MQRNGLLTNPEQLADHNRPVFNLLADSTLWGYTRSGRTQEIGVHDNAQSNNSEAIREMVVSGLSIALSPDGLFGADISAGSVQAVLEGYQADALPVHALMPANRRQSARTQAFISYLSEALAPLLSTV